jgi:hypothetical protein
MINLQFNLTYLSLALISKYSLKALNTIRSESLRTSMKGICNLAEPKFRTGVVPIFWVLQRKDTASHTRRMCLHTYIDNNLKILHILKLLL